MCQPIGAPVQFTVTDPFVSEHYRYGVWRFTRLCFEQLVQT
jgi:hypothetical protein